MFLTIIDSNRAENACLAAGYPELGSRVGNAAYCTRLIDGTSEVKTVWFDRILFKDE
jgi:hypothetical protein